MVEIPSSENVFVRQLTSIGDFHSITDEVFEIIEYAMMVAI
ncbi:hypothetical protein CNE_BB1p03130 (plasmid) [Cupriavidus necator N-1]|uniref:Uncharacterized protein n=1 Tax=Cupriavidus necator (strain ATCC 43291 / DSM 13513 / CCUG 52238 / LMG 8453 / N-1) TaxID=1042878 RepID=F8GWL7_CUPNN|nr:hypothetical protein CNE_BB1p03130 [Cupriavidus necator N-1]